MKILKRTMLVLGIIIALVLVISLFLPSKFEVKRSAVIAAPQDSVFMWVADFKNWKQWSPWQANDPAMKMTLSPTSLGPGATMAWESEKEGNGKMTYKSIQPSSEAIYTLKLNDWGMESEGKFMLEPDGEKTKVTWTMTGDVGMNPISKFGLLMMDGYVGKDFEAGLENMKKMAAKK